MKLPNLGNLIKLPYLPEFGKVNGTPTFGEDYRITEITENAQQLT